MSTPKVDFSKFPEAATALEISRELRRQGHRVWPLRPDGAGYSPIVTGEIEDGWRAATRAEGVIDRLFRDDSISVGIAGGTLQAQAWYHCDGASVVLVSQVGLPPPPSERRTEFLPRVLPDLRGPAARRTQIQAAISELLEQEQRIAVKMSAAQGEIQRHQSLKDEHAELSGKISEAEALAFINDAETELKGEEKRLASIATQLKKSASALPSAKQAMKILEAKAATTAGMVTSLRRDLQSAESNWLRARQHVAVERLRKQLHSLHETIALMLAIENHASFEGTQAAWRLIETFQKIMPYGSDYRPDWVDSDRARLFPGFAAASDIVASEIASGNKNEKEDA